MDRLDISARHLQHDASFSGAADDQTRPALDGTRNGDAGADETTFGRFTAGVVVTDFVGDDFGYNRQRRRTVGSLKA